MKISEVGTGKFDADGIRVDERGAGDIEYEIGDVACARVMSCRQRQTESITVRGFFHDPDPEVLRGLTRAAASDVGECARALLDTHEWQGIDDFGAHPRRRLGAAIAQRDAQVELFAGTGHSVPVTADLGDDDAGNSEESLAVVERDRAFVQVGP